MNTESAVDAETPFSAYDIFGRGPKPKAVPEADRYHCNLAKKQKKAGGFNPTNDKYLPKCVAKYGNVYKV